MYALLDALVVWLGSHPNTALAIVFAISAAEALFVVGLFIPSTVVLVGAGALIGGGQLAFWPIYLAATAGAIVGDAASYAIGHHYRERLTALWPFSRYTSIITRGQAFFTRYGTWSIFIARFIPAVKSIVPGIAGMMGMRVIPFAIVNVVSAFAWAAAHILPGMSAGSGLARFWESNPRLVILAGLALTGLLLLWYVAKLLLGLGWPWLKAAYDWLDTWAGRSSGRTGRWTRSILRNEEGLAVALFWVALIVTFLMSFVVTLLAFMFEPQLNAADGALSAFMQGLRNPVGDHIMTAVTMAGDSHVVTVLAVISIGWLLIFRYWSVAAATLIAILGASAFVPLVKSTLQRARPNELYSGAESFSFPSGHATLSATIIGIVAILLAHNAKGGWRTIIYSVAVLMVAAIALSRVYLAAHWPSDVLAGVSFGLAIAAALAFFLRSTPLRIRAPLFACVLLIGYGAAYGFNFQSNYAEWNRKYDYTAPVIAMAQSEWLGGGWRKIEPARGTFEGETDEALIVQTDLSPDALTMAFTAEGWTTDAASSLNRLTAMALPSRLPLSKQPALPRYHAGRSPALVLVRSEPDNAYVPRRLAVLAFALWRWRTYEDITPPGRFGHQ